MNSIQHNGKLITNKYNSNLIIFYEQIGIWFSLSKMEYGKYAPTNSSNFQKESVSLNGRIVDGIQLLFFLVAVRTSFFISSSYCICNVFHGREKPTRLEVVFYLITNIQTNKMFLHLIISEL